MPIDPASLTALLADAKPAIAAYWLVEWDANDSNEDRYYSDSAYNQMPPFMGVGVEIEARILNSVVKDTQFEINPDLKTEKISLTFDDIDKEITTRFQEFKSGVRCELFFYFPNNGLPITTSVWFGQLQAPEVYGYKTVKTSATNGFRSREQLIGKRNRPRECTSNFGAWMPGDFERESNLCPYEDGVLGLPGETDCPRDTVATCNTKLATSDGKYFGGFDTSVANIPVAQHDGGVAISRGNQSATSEPIRVIFGQKYVRGLPLLAWRRNGQGNNSFVATLFEVCEGPVSTIYAPRVNGSSPGANQWWGGTRGERGQPRGSYSSDISNFSNTAHFNFVFGPVNPAGYNASNLVGECKVTGYEDVAVFSTASVYGRQWTDSRVWCLFEIYTNQRFGMANPSTKFEILDWIDEDYRSRYEVSFTALFPDGETKVYSGRRTTFDCTLEARPVAEQIEDICRSGAVSVPFQHDGKYTLKSFRKATALELSGARVFTDTGTGKNILWGEGQPAITLSQTPDDKVVNEIELKFEEETNTDTERTAKFDDPNQKLRAGRVLGDDNLQSVPKKFAAFGIRYEQEVARLGYRLLRFGEFDEGGTQNNLKATFTVPFVQSLGIKRYDIIKIVSSLLDDFTIGTNDGVNNYVETPQYFRVQKMKKTGNGTTEMTCQAYNHTAYSAFETVTDDTPGAPLTAPVIIIPPDPPQCRLEVGTVTYDTASGTLNLFPPECCPPGYRWSEELLMCVPI